MSCRVWKLDERLARPEEALDLTCAKRQERWKLVNRFQPSSALENSIQYDITYRCITVPVKYTVLPVTIHSQG